MYLYLPKRHKSIKENILARLAIPAAVEGVITAAPQHGWSLGETRDWGSIWGLGVLLKSCPYLDSKTPSIWLFPCIQKLSAKSCRNCFAFFFKKKAPQNRIFQSVVCLLSGFWNPWGVTEWRFSILVRDTYLPLKNYEITWGTDRKPGDGATLGFGYSWRWSHWQLSITISYSLSSVAC